MVHLGGLLLALYMFLTYAAFVYLFIYLFVCCFMSFPLGAIFVVEIVYGICMLIALGLYEE